MPPITFGSKHLVGSLGSLIITGPGEDTSHLLFHIETPAALEGSVRNNLDEPVGSALVTIWRSGVYGGRRRVTPFRFIYTDDRGYYRAAPLPGGTYYVSASGTPWYSQPDKNSLAESYLPVFFPNTTEPASAAEIRLEPGKEATADLILTAAPGASVRVIMKGNSSPLMIHFSQPGMRGATRSIRTENMYGPDRVFVGMAPGRYLLRANNPRGPQEGFAVAPADVLPGVETKVEMAFTTGAAISGTVHVDPKLAGSAKLMVTFLGADGTLGGMPLPVRPDGTFQGSSILPGTYTVGVTGLSWAQVVELTAEGTTVGLGRRIEVPESGAIRLNMRLDRGNASIAGKVLDSAGKPVTGALVLAGRRTGNKKDEIDEFRAYATETDGSFDYQWLQPGTYLMMAFRDADELEYQEPAVYKELLHAAVEVVLGDGARVKRDLTVP